MPRRKGPQPSPITPSRISLANGIKSALAFNSSANRKPRTMEELAEVSGLALRTLYNMKNMSKSPEVANMDRVAEALGIQTWALLYMEEDAALLYLLESWRQADEEGRRYLLRLAR